jgi:hypothetical protein
LVRSSISRIAELLLMVCSEKYFGECFAGETLASLMVT